MDVLEVFDSRGSFYLLEFPLNLLSMRVYKNFRGVVVFFCLRFLEADYFLLRCILSNLSVMGFSIMVYYSLLIITITMQYQLIINKYRCGGGGRGRLLACKPCCPVGGIEFYRTVAFIGEEGGYRICCPGLRGKTIHFCIR